MGGFEEVGISTLVLVSCVEGEVAVRGASGSPLEVGVVSEDVVNVGSVASVVDKGN